MLASTLPASPAAPRARRRSRSWTLTRGPRVGGGAGGNLGGGGGAVGGAGWARLGWAGLGRARWRLACMHSCVAAAACFRAGREGSSGAAAGCAGPRSSGRARFTPGPARWRHATGVLPALPLQPQFMLERLAHRLLPCWSHPPRPKRFPRDSRALPPRCADAINLAVRFGAPIYVNRDIAVKMARGRLEEHNESHTQIVRSCRCGWLTSPGGRGGGGVWGSCVREPAARRSSWRRRRGWRHAGRPAGAALVAQSRY